MPGLPLTPDPVVSVSKYRGDSDLEAVEVEELLEKPLGVVGLRMRASRDCVYIARWSDMLSRSIDAVEVLRGARVCSRVIAEVTRATACCGCRF